MPIARSCRACFQNLIGNAVKFRGDAPPRIHISCALLETGTKNARWQIGIRDNGIGFDPQFADRIFAIFQRLHTRDQYPGTGMGLAISKKIVERHGGTIWAESSPGQGSTFTLTIPAQMRRGKTGTRPGDIPTSEADAAPAAR